MIARINKIGIMYLASKYYGENDDRDVYKDGEDGHQTTSTTP